MYSRPYGVPILGMLLITVLLQGPVSAEEPSPTRDLRPTMQAIFQALT